MSKGVWLDVVEMECYVSNTTEGLRNKVEVYRGYAIIPKRSRVELQL